MQNAKNLNTEWYFTLEDFSFRKYLGITLSHVPWSYSIKKILNRQQSGLPVSLTTYILMYLCRTSSHGRQDRQKIEQVFHRITDWLRLESNPRGHLVQLQTKFTRTMSTRPLNVSKCRDSSASLSKLFQYSVTLTIIKCFFKFRWNFLWSSLCPLPLVLSVDITNKSLDPPSLHPTFRFLYTLIKSPILSLLKAKQFQLSHPLLIRKICQSLNHLNGLLLGSPVPPYLCSTVCPCVSLLGRFELNISGQEQSA